MHKALTLIAAVILAIMSPVSGANSDRAYADDQFEKLKSQLGDKDQKAVARALSQAAALARICKRQIDDAQFQSAMRISGIEAQDLADGGKLYGATQDGLASIDASACAVADRSFGSDGSDVSGLLK